MALMSDAWAEEIAKVTAELKALQEEFSLYKEASHSQAEANRETASDLASYMEMNDMTIDWLTESQGALAEN